MLERHRQCVPRPAARKLLGFERLHIIVKAVDSVFESDKEGTERAAEFAALFRLVSDEFAAESKLNPVRFDSRAQRRKLLAKDLSVGAQVGEVPRGRGTGVGLDRARAGATAFDGSHGLGSDGWSPLGANHRHHVDAHCLRILCSMAGENSPDVSTA